MEAAATTLLPYMFALMHEETGSNFDKFFADFLRPWDCGSDAVRQLHKDYAPGIEQARRQNFQKSRPANEYPHLKRNLYTEVHKSPTHNEPSCTVLEEYYFL